MFSKNRQQRSSLKHNTTTSSSTTLTKDRSPVLPTVASSSHSNGLSATPNSTSTPAAVQSNFFSKSRSMVNVSLKDQRAMRPRPAATAVFVDDWSTCFVSRRVVLRRPFDSLVNVIQPVAPHRRQLAISPVPRSTIISPPAISSKMNSSNPSFPRATITRSTSSRRAATHQHWRPVFSVATNIHRSSSNACRFVRTRTVAAVCEAI